MLKKILRLIPQEKQLFCSEQMLSNKDIVYVTYTHICVCWEAIHGVMHCCSPSKQCFDEYKAF